MKTIILFISIVPIVLAQRGGGPATAKPEVYGGSACVIRCATEEYCTQECPARVNECKACINNINAGQGGRAGASYSQNCKGSCSDIDEFTLNYVTSQRCPLKSKSGNYRLCIGNGESKPPPYSQSQIQPPPYSQSQIQPPPYSQSQTQPPPTSVGVSVVSKCPQLTPWFDIPNLMCCSNA